MQALLSFDQAPPISAPLRFFLTAPLFAMLAGVLLLYSGPGLYVSRWTPAALALTHLMTVGFMLQVMLGALQQLLPVVVGANLSRPLQLATLVHASITPGALFLASAFLTQQAWLFAAAVICLAVGVGTFVVAVTLALRGMANSNPTLLGFKLSLLGLTAVALSGLGLAAALGLALDLPLVQWTDLHMGWGFLAWGGTLIVAVAFVTVPMFQMTPEYPVWFSRNFTRCVLVAIVGWTLSDLVNWTTLAEILITLAVACAALACITTLQLLRRSKRAKREASHHLWNTAMGSALAASALWLSARFIPAVDHWPGWPLLLGTLLLFGCFMSVILGMLYKIVPFLVWLHLQNCSASTPAPNMKKVLPQIRIDRQMVTHLLACLLLLLSVFWPEWFVYPAGLTLIVASAWLLSNLLYATAIYRSHIAVSKGRGAGKIENSLDSDA